MNDSLFVHRVQPNEQPAKEYLTKTYGPQAQKTFVGALEAFFANEFPQMAGDRARRAVVQGIVEMVQSFFPQTTHLSPGQTTWVTIAKNETAAYGKTIPKTRMVPTIISILAADEAAQRRDGGKLRKIKIVTNFRQVFTCKIKGLSTDETARATKLSKRLVEEYHRLFDEYAVTSAKFDRLLKDSTASTINIPALRFRATPWRQIWYG